MTRPPALASAELPRCENAPWARSPVTATASSTATTAVRAAAVLSVTCDSVRCPGNETLSVSYTRRGAFVEFPLQWALKDVDLAIGAAPGATLPLLAALSRQWRSIVDAGHGRDDVSVARLGLADTS